MKILSRALPALVVASLLTVGVVPVRAELPPDVYEEMQAEAPEAFVVEIKDAKLRTVKEKDYERTSVFAQAVVKEVKRSASGVKVGQTISIRYVSTRNTQPGWVGPGPIGIVSKGNTLNAYLKKAGPHFYPAARGWTFIDARQ